MYSVRSRALQCLRPHIRSFSEAPIPRPAVVEKTEKPRRVANNLNGISIPHQDETRQSQQIPAYRPNINYLKAKPGLAAQLAMRNSNGSKTSAILGNGEKNDSQKPINTRPKAVGAQAIRTRAQVNVGPRVERRPRSEDGKPPTRERRINAQDRTGQPTGRPANFRPNAGNGPRRGGFAPRPQPPRAPQSPPNNRQRFTPRQASSNTSQKGQDERRQKRKRAAKQVEDNETSGAVTILDQCPPDVAHTPDFSHSDLQSLLSTPSEEAQRPRSVFERTGGDYSRYVPQTSTVAQDSKLSTISNAEAALVRRREVDLTQKSKVVDVVKRSVGLQAKA